MQMPLHVGIWSVLCAHQVCGDQMRHVTPSMEASPAARVHMDYMCSLTVPQGQ